MGSKYHTIVQNNVFKMVYGNDKRKVQHSCETFSMG